MARLTKNEISALLDLHASTGARTIEVGTDEQPWKALRNKGLLKLWGKGWHGDVRLTLSKRGEKVAAMLYPACRTLSQIEYLKAFLLGRGAL
jgi:hypothetical protein